MFKNLHCLFFLPLLLLVGCSNKGENLANSIKTPSSSQRKITSLDTFAVAMAPSQSLMSVPHHSGSKKSGTFRRLKPQETGIDFTCQLDPDHEMSRLYHSGYACGGVAIGDVDNDGRADLFLAGGRQPNRLYRQTEDFRFEDISDSAGIGGGDSWGTGVTLIDIDNDLDLDVYICNYDSPNQLFVNQGAGRFIESAKQWGLDLVEASFFPAFCDFDRDGDLDLYLLTNRYYRKGGRPKAPPVSQVNGKLVVRPEFEKYYTLTEKGPGRFGIDDYGRDDYLFLNQKQANGKRKFEDITERSGIYGHGYGLSATWWDYNADGWPDLYVCNDYNEPDRLYHNNGNGTFTDRLVDAVPHTPWFSMGSDAADINNDGLFDLFVVDMSGTNHFKRKTTMGVMNAARLAEVAGPPPQNMRNALLLNAGNERFMEIAYMAGMADSDWSWAAKLADLDNDGRVDAFVSNGIVRNFNDSDIPFTEDMLIGRTKWDIYKHADPRPEQNLAFRNEGHLKFSNVSEAWGLDHVGVSYGAAWGDLDNDGDLDLVVANVDEPISVFRNEIETGHRATFRLVGQASNRFGLGAQIEIETKSGKQVRELSPMTGFLSCNQPIVHFGLGSDDAIETATIRWPSGTVQELTSLPGNRHFVVTEPVKDASPSQNLQRTDDEIASKQEFVEVSDFTQISHHENEFDDFAVQPLLPNRLSQFGPGMAWGDLDADGDHDMFLGGGSGHPGSLWRNDGAGHFSGASCPDIAMHAHHEDLGAIFFDVDGDGDQDLYVVSGGTEPCPRRDRIYLNQGDGKLVYDESALPNLQFSGSVVAANDFDRDGDLDLFVGSRLIPGEYPLAPKSQLLRNDHGVFTNVIENVAPELASAGMVTGAVWSDANGDGRSDLIVTYDWGPIRLFINQQGRLVDHTDDVGLAAYTGWWNGIAAGDIDNDGDIDYVATNFGLNTKYHASQSKPALLYYGDFENSGRKRLVEAEFEDQRLFPLRGKSCSTHAMPFLRNKFTSYKAFALADLGEIYTNECLAESHRSAVTTLESCVLINEQGKFRVEPLPRLAQNSPAFGLALFDYDADGKLDLYIAQNFFGPQPETGRMDGGLSLLMRGNGDGSFTTIWPDQSGIHVPGDAKSVAVVDLNSDTHPDLITASNQGPVQAFLNQPHKTESGQRLEIRLLGDSKNRVGIGAIIKLHFAEGATQIREIQAGSGYLSQSPPVALFAFPADARPDSIEVQWPNGSTSSHQVESGKSKQVIAMDALTN